MSPKEQVQIALPGDALNAGPKTIPGPGTHTHHNILAASLAGPMTTTKSHISIAHLSSPTSATTNTLPTVGAIVLVRILRLTTRSANGAILTIAPPRPSSSATPALAEPCAEPFACTLRREDMRATEKDKVRVADSFRPGDIVRAEVISLGDQSGYYVSTARNELGVVLAQAADGSGGIMVPLSWREMLDPESGVREARKVAKP